MPRRSKGPSLYLKRRTGYPAFWYIRDGAKRVATGCSESEHRRALGQLSKYINRTQTPSFGEGDPHTVSIASVIALYAQDKAPKTSRPRATAARLKRVLDYFTDKPVAHLTPTTCLGFVQWWGSEQAARRALEDLRAALTYAWKCRKLNAMIPIDMPSKAAARERWLTKKEARRLICTASKRAPHLLRFVLLGLYTGTRSSAILSLGWKPHPDGGHIDLEHRLLYRRPLNTRETANKRRPPHRIHPILQKRLQRWQKTSKGRHIVQWEGAGIKSVKTAWATLRVAAKLSTDVTPHTLRHTYVTWLLQGGTSIWDTAQKAGMSPRIVEQVYGHHAVDFGS